MRYALLITGMLLLAPAAAPAGGGNASGLSERSGADAPTARQQWLSQDLHLSAGDLLTCRTADGQHVLVCRRSSAMILAGRQHIADNMVVWIKAANLDTAPSGGYSVQVYLQGRVSSKRTDSAQDVDIKEVVIEPGKALVVSAAIRGEVFVTADVRQTGSPYELPLYREAVAGFGGAGLDVPAPGASAGVTTAQRENRREDEAPSQYTVSVAPIGDTLPEVESTRIGDAEVSTVIGRVYIWWQEQGQEADRPQVVDVQADSLVIWRRPTGATRPSSGGLPMQQVDVSEIYVAGDVLMTQGQRTIRATELYYDLRNQRGLVKNAVMRTFDVTRNVPIYARAGELRQLDENRFEADDVVVTTSEFWTPQLSATAARVSIIDRITEVEPDGLISPTNYTAGMRDVRVKYYEMTLLRLPSMNSNLVSPSVPLRSIRAGRDSTFGASVETQWFLGRILGLQEPEGTDSTLYLDYYDKRGAGGGVGVEYERETYFGRVLGYAIDDHGEDRLGRTRKNIEPPDELRGRFSFQHRHFLPYDWQLTAEASYLSDRNFLEQFYRSEFYAGKEQETLLHLKRIEDNRGLAFLGKARINDFLDEMEELPSAEYHWTGESLLDDRLVLFSDSLASRLRYRFDEDRTGDREDFFTFAQTRNEIDMPLHLGRSQVVPFIAGTVGYDDGAGFGRELDGPAPDGEDAIWVGEAGTRMSMQPFWRVNPGVESRLLDLRGLRHTIRPSITAVTYAESDAVAEQRDTLNLSIDQRWQTKRGPGQQRTVDWLALDVDFVWVSDSADDDSTVGPDRFLWNQPFIPLINRSGGAVPPQDRRVTDRFGPQRNYASAAMTWRASETTSLLGDIYVDMQRGTVEQLNAGVSRLVWPNLSYFIGSRYLRDIDNGLGEQGSNAVTFAVTYVLDPRYTAVFSQQYDFDYDANIRNDITLIRKYHRVNFAVTLSVDGSLDEERLVFSLWPEGVPELAIGLRRYMGLGTPEAVY